MNRKILSRVDQKLLVSVLDTRNMEPGRVDSADQHEILQVSAMSLKQGRRVNPHKHLPTLRSTVGTQECWVVFSGLVKVQLFDIDNTVIDAFVLETGECMTTYRGGHTLEILDDAVIVEIKNGPYYGAQLDSQPIN
jgi:mannose-6-phosphate isomerase-like protein (cupin superfamily)